ncbi:3-methyl-2-oxobutanoate hydroxymethyltransferase [Heracleum sosnowskyi]|uniref:3-methyl-2-oxobutanoate hydroxymethyltransferase n=1 Tax=Heracleum sosnowskyi TaxID=360622 RepID=A0AAD8J024_9APIA|nr:3-methyl-2-oxobutanoate hydroxymethyltransferase [Heracleum sosnowskyi]
MIFLRLGGAICTTKRIPFSCCSVQSRIKTEKNGPEFISGEQLKSELRGGGAPASAAAALRADTNNGGGVEVPRQKYIATSKSHLLHAIVVDEDDDFKHQFLLLSSCLDSILHAEHKSILEEMRVDYDLLQSTRYKETTIAGEEDDSELSSAVNDPNNSEVPEYKPNGIGQEQLEGQFESILAMPSTMAFDLKYLFDSLKTKNVKKIPNEESRTAVATRFQRAFIQLLYNAQFEELSEADLMLTSALNTDYLLTLPIYVDWKKASESKAIIFRRGYTTEKQKGLLIGEKLDYLQSRLLLRIFFLVAKPLRKVGSWLAEAVKQSIQRQNTKAWANKMKLWLEEMPLSQWPYSFDENEQNVDQFSEEDLPIWLAAQRAVNRYEGILSSLGPRSRLLRKFLTWMELIPSMPKRPSKLESNVKTIESHLRPISLPRISLGDIWEPATIKFCGNDLWKMFKAAFTILSSKSSLQEPAFQELILLYTEEMDEIEAKDTSEIPSLQLKIYETIPIPELPVIFPHKKLSFRILDTVRLDAATIVGLLAFFINYKFEDIKSSPSAVLLDVIAISALIISVSRIVLGYKQTWDRYQLLVNRTLYEKTVASGFGSIHFLLDASEQQQYKEAILAYAILLREENGQVTCIEGVKDRCERFMYNVFKEKVDMPIRKAINTLARLGLVKEKSINGQTEVQAVPCPDAYEILKQRWNSLLTDIP